MNSLKSRNKKIILSVTAGIFIISTVTVASLYAKYNTNKSDTIKDPRTGLTKQEEQKARRYDPNKDEEYDLLRKYIIKVIKVLQKGTKNAQQKLNLKEYQIGIAYLEEAISFGKGASLIVDRAIEVSLRNEKKVELKGDRDALNAVLKEAIKALEVAKNELKKLVEYQAIVNEAIANIESTIKKSEGAVTIPEFNFIITELEKLNALYIPVEAKARELLLIEEADKLAKTLEASVAKIAELKSKIGNQSIDQQKESVKVFTNGLQEKINKIKEKAAKAQTAVDIEDVLKEIKYLTDSAKAVKDLADTLGLTEDSAKIANYIKVLEAEEKALKDRLEQKNRTNRVLQDRTKAFVEEIQNHIKNSENVKSLKDIDDIIAKIEQSIKNSIDLQKALRDEKLSKELGEVRDAISEAQQKLENIKNQKRDIEDQIQTEKENITRIVTSLDSDYKKADEESKKTTGDTSALRNLKSKLQISEATYDRLNADTNIFVKPHIADNIAALKNKIDEIKGKVKQVEDGFARNQKDLSETYVSKLLERPDNVYYGNQKLSDVMSLKEHLPSNIDKNKDKLVLKINEGLVDLDTNVKIETDYNDVEGKLLVRVRVNRFGVEKEKIWTFNGYQKFEDYFAKNKRDLLELSYRGTKTLKEKIKEEYGDKLLDFIAAIRAESGLQRWDFLKENGFSYRWKIEDVAKPVALSFLIDEFAATENSITLIYRFNAVIRNATEATFGQKEGISGINGDNKAEATIFIE
ncbi:hypothetical protein DA803_01480 [[Mycoplasma] phocae]|uniref:Uncharacterized protein n=1 Tax=[Mycoplasma] phocae TaxID=142651 RepID=A0A2Z5IR86_9BACT|nr:hypothetical protein [[Mycoplasma] phocae]AXE60756.1 hypothetical protein DA803_01480 [[Mycoplasma] phocae]